VLRAVHLYALTIGLCRHPVPDASLLPLGEDALALTFGRMRLRQARFARHIFCRQILPDGSQLRLPYACSTGRRAGLPSEAASIIEITDQQRVWSHRLQADLLNAIDDRATAGPNYHQVFAVERRQSEKVFRRL